MSKNREKRQNCRKTIKSLKNTGKNRQKYRKTVKNVEKPLIRRQK